VAKTGAVPGSPPDAPPPADADETPAPGDPPRELTGQQLAGMWSAKRQRLKRASADRPDVPRH
jgi:hypothetical protein